MCEIDALSDLRNVVLRMIELIRKGESVMKEQGLPPNTSFKIMELVRKGKVAKEPEKWAAFKKTMEEYHVPQWYIDSCNKIKYLFPKAHAAAYVTNAFRIAWFKVHIPKAYYTAYFTIRADAFDSEVMCHGQERVKNKMKEIELLGNAATQKDSAMYETLEIVNEMYERKITFLPIDLYKSGATNFKVINRHKLSIFSCFFNALCCNTSKSRNTIKWYRVIEKSRMLGRNEPK